MTIENGQQLNVANSIKDITVKAEAGYYLPDDYIKNIQGLNGLSATETKKGYSFKISGTPTSDVNIKLPTATALPKADTPKVAISTTANAITANVTNHKAEFGDIEYKLDNGNFVTDKNVLSNLKADTQYNLAIRFKGNGFYQMSDEFSTSVRTLKDGSLGGLVPTIPVLSITYKKGLRLSDIQLPQGWAWENKDTSFCYTAFIVKNEKQTNNNL